MVVWREWRRPRSEWAWATVAFVVSYVVVVDLYVQSQISSRWVLDVIEMAFLVVGALLSYRVFVHARVSAGPDALEIANPFRSTYTLTWESIASMRADRLLIIRDTSGRRHIAWVIQKNGWSRSKGLRSEADDAIDELGALAGRALGGAPRSYATSH
jgi:hypothetical protein